MLKFITVFAVIKLLICIFACINLFRKKWRLVYVSGMIITLMSISQIIMTLIWGEYKPLSFVVALLVVPCWAYITNTAEKRLPE